MGSLVPEEYLELFDIFLKFLVCLSRFGPDMDL